MICNREGIKLTLYNELVSYKKEVEKREKLHFATAEREMKLAKELSVEKANVASRTEELEELEYKFLIHIIIKRT